MFEPHSETSLPPSETTPARSPDFKQTVRQFIHQLGGKVGWDGSLLLGTEQSFLEDEDGRVVEYDKEVGMVDSVELITETQENFDENDGVFKRKEKYVYCQEYRFGPDLKPHFKTLIAALPADQFCRVLRADTELVIRIYNNLTSEQTADFQEQTQSLPNGVVGFTQGEWVVVRGDDPHHQIASFGRNMDGCRYWLVYDPNRKIAAASHLDLVIDVEAVTEMAAALIQRGSSPNDLQVNGSPNASQRAKRQISTQFPNAIFDLEENDIIFDVKTGERSYPSQEILMQLAGNTKAHERLIKILNTRMKYQIGHVLRYESPGL